MFITTIRIDRCDVEHRISIQTGITYSHICSSTSNNLCKITARNVRTHASNVRVNLLNGRSCDLCRLMHLPTPPSASFSCVPTSCTSILWCLSSARCITQPVPCVRVCVFVCVRSCRYLCEPVGNVGGGSVVSQQKHTQTKKTSLAMPINSQCPVCPVLRVHANCMHTVGVRVSTQQTLAAQIHHLWQKNGKRTRCRTLNTFQSSNEHVRPQVQQSLSVQPCFTVQRQDPFMYDGRCSFGSVCKVRERYNVHAIARIWMPS